MTGDRARRRGVALAVAGLLLLSVVSSGVGAGAEDPRFVTTVPERTVTPGQTQTLQVQLENTAEDPENRVETATDVRATLESGDTNVSVLSGERLVGRLGNDAVRSLGFTIRVPRDIAAGTHRLALRVSYVDAEDERRTTRVPVTIRVEPRPRFRIVNTSADVPVGDDGPVTVTIENVGEETARDATLTLRSQASVLRFGQSATSSRFVGSLAPGERRTVEYRVTASPEAEAQSYAFTATVSFEDQDGNPGESTALAVGVTPLGDQSFTLGNATSTLRVGEEGEVRVTVTNRGPRTAREAVLRLVSENPNVLPQVTEIAIGRLQAGGSVQATFPIEIAEDGVATPRQLGFVVEYRDRDGDLARSDTLSAIVDVAESRPDFVVDINRNRVEEGASTAVRIRVTNNLDQTLRNIDAKAFFNDPLSSDDDEAFIGGLAPGESATITLEVSADASATPKSYPMQIDFQYELPDGDTRLSDTYRLPIEVTPQTDDGSGSGLGGLVSRLGAASGLTPIVIGAAVLVLAAVGVILYRRRVR